MPPTVTGSRAGATDGRVLRGDRTRRAILRRAVDLASVEGLDALTIGRLAADVDASKSGVFARFGSKQDLQLATIEAAREIFIEEVVEPARRTPPGLRRVWAMSAAWLDYSQRRVFPGGCFFAAAAAEFAARPGPMRDAIATARRDWLVFYEREITRARDAGEVVPDTNPQLLAFELDAVATGANAAAQLHGDMGVYELARTAMRARLAAVATDAALLALE